MLKQHATRSKTLTPRSRRPPSKFADESAEVCKPKRGTKRKAPQDAVSKAPAKRSTTVTVRASAKRAPAKKAFIPAEKVPTKKAPTKQANGKTRPARKVPTMTAAACALPLDPSDLEKIWEERERRQAQWAKEFEQQQAERRKAKDAQVRWLRSASGPANNAATAALVKRVAKQVHAAVRRQKHGWMNRPHSEVLVAEVDPALAPILLGPAPLGKRVLVTHLSREDVASWLGTAPRVEGVKCPGYKSSCAMLTEMSVAYNTTQRSLKLSMRTDVCGYDWHSWDDMY